MVANSKIQWTDHTFNPVLGCTKVGPGCDLCYAETWAKRYGVVQWGDHPRKRTAPANWGQVRKWDREAAATGKRPIVFCASLADVFDNQWNPQWREDLWALVRETKHLFWVFVTKRIGNALRMLPGDWPQAFPHCMICITVVNQAEADRDIPKLMQTPAAHRGLSVEPLLGPMDLRSWLVGSSTADFPPSIVHPGLDWVKIGGESGTGARRMSPEWAHRIITDCAAAGVPVFMKQMGSALAVDLGLKGKGDDMAEWDPAFQVRQFPAVMERA